MRFATLTTLMVFAVSSALAQTVEDEVATCYRNAKKQSETHACLLLELRAVQASYNDVLERVLTEARIIDRMNKKKKASKTLTEANRNFDAFVKNECAFRDIGKGFDAENSDVALTCKINLLRLRKSSLQMDFLSPQ